MTEPTDGPRKQQAARTRALLVEAAVETLKTDGAAALTTVAVQRRAGVSRGALLHHFPTRGDLVRAVVGRLVELNEAAVEVALAATPDEDAVRRAVRALFASVMSESSLLETELWVSARTNNDLRDALRDAERAAGWELERVVARAFGPQLAAHPRFGEISTMTLTFLRGLALSGLLRRSDTWAEPLLDSWTATIHAELARHTSAH